MIGGRVEQDDLDWFSEQHYAHLYGLDIARDRDNRAWRVSRGPLGTPLREFVTQLAEVL